MAFTLQLRDARNSLALKSIVGTCTDGEDFRALLNEAMRRLLRRGGWWNTEFLMRLCIYNGCLVWPRIVGTVLGVKTSCGDHPLRNNWYSIIGPAGCDAICDNTIYDVGTSATYNAISGSDGKYIRVYPTKLEDQNKTITLFGLDSNGQPLQEKVGGVWQRGLTLIMKVPYVQSPILISRIDSVTREQTQANVIMYEYDTTTDTQRDIALYEPTETNPQYRNSKINGYCSIPTGCSEENGIVRKTIQALVKLNFQDVVAEEDFLPIDNIDAIKFALQAIRLEEANQDEAAEIKLMKAVSELNFELRQKLPGNQTTVRVNPTGRMIYSPI